MTQSPDIVHKKGAQGGKPSDYAEEIIKAEHSLSPKVKGKPKQDLRLKGNSLHGHLGISNSSLILRQSQQRYQRIENVSDVNIGEDAGADEGSFNLFTHLVKRKANQPLEMDYPNLRQAVMELFLSVKIRSDEEIDAYNKDKFEAEKQELKEVDGFTLIDYIKQSIEMLMNMKMEENTPAP